MKKTLKTLVSLFMASLTAAFFMGCPSGGVEGEEPTGEVVTVIENQAVCWSELQIPAEDLALAKAGAKVIFKVANNTQPADDTNPASTYCKTLVMNGSWDNPGVIAIYGPDGDIETKTVEETTNEQGTTVHRPYAEGEGEWYFYLTEDMLNADKLIFSGCFTMEYCKIEYIGGKKEIEPVPELPEGDYVKTITLVKNTYAPTPQVQVKIPTGLVEFKTGDEITVTMKGVATKEFAAELYIVDNSPNAGGKDNYWGPLTVKNDDDDGKELVTVGTTFDITKTFVLTSDPLGTAAEVNFAINGTDGDSTILLGCTEFSITSSNEDAVPPVTEGPVNYTASDVIFTLADNPDGSNNQYHASASTYFGSVVPAEGDKYQIYLKGSISTDIATACVGFTAGWSWTNCAMAGGIALTNEALGNGVTVNVTFKGENGHTNLWIYSTEMDEVTDGITLTLSEFKVTQVVED